MSEITRIRPGTRMSQVVIHNGTAHLAGQVGTEGAPVADQTRATLAAIDALLAEAGTDRSRLLTAQIWLASMDDFAEMNAVWDAWIDPANPPARWCGEARLATPGYLVEIIVTAAV